MAVRPPAMKPVRHNTELPPVAQAANIALILMGFVKVTSWARLAEVHASHPDTFDTIVVTREQQALLDEFDYILPYLKASSKTKSFGLDVPSPARTLYACAVCERFAFIDTASAPGPCNLTLGCRGRGMKASTVQRRLTAAEKDTVEEAKLLQKRDVAEGKLAKANVDVLDAQAKLDDAVAASADKVDALEQVRAAGGTAAQITRAEKAVASAATKQAKAEAAVATAKEKATLAEKALEAARRMVSLYTPSAAS